MEVKKGYKQTEVGVIPEDWKVKKLGEIGSFKKGKGIKKDAVISDGFPCVRYGELYTTHNEYIKQFKSYISIETARESQRINKGDILFAGSGETKEEIGKCAAFLGEDEAYAGGDVIILSLKEMDSLYLGFLLNHEVVVKQKAQRAQGDAVVHIYPNNLTDIFIPLPPTKAEQTAIAAALSDADALIASLEKLIAKKRNIKQGAMQELLTGKKRLPGFSGTWERVIFNDIICRFSTGLNPRQNFELNSGGNLYYVTIKNFSNGKLFLDDKCDKIDNTAFLKINERSDLRKDDIIFASIGRVGDAYLIKETPTNWNINESVFSLRPKKEKIYPLMLYHIFTNENIKNFLDQNITGSTFKSIKMADLRLIPCSIPTSKDEQQVIATTLSDMDAEISALETKLAKYKQIKQGMMQELLTGKTRLI